ncbi:MAG TPA: Nif3-like dinuclear metal center hexameric protein [Polyangiaceae bacterium]|nr:Nif3-like dinuclear metal center hexameric protein [Polyangiaceae bacterium]
MNVLDLMRAMEEIAPTAFAAPWDNVGLLVGDPDRDVARVLLTIDCTRAVLDEALRARCDAIVSYHPPLFEAQKTFVAGSIAYEAARAALAVYSPHTALDAAEGGTNDVLADAVGMTERAPVRDVAPRDGDREPPGAARRGFGRVGPVPRTTVLALAGAVKRALGATHVLVAGPADREITRVAVCAGSGGDLVQDAARAGAELVLTGELRHHDALRARAAGMVAVCTLHSVSERAALVALERRLAARMPGVHVVRSLEDRDPFVFV